VSNQFILGLSVHFRAARECLMRRFKITLQDRSGERKTIVLGPVGTALATLVLGLIVVLILGIGIAVGYLFIGVILVILLLALVVAVLAGALKSLRPNKR
jgi:hypothetical protein